MWLVINLMKQQRIYNEKVRQFPTKLAAMIFGFKAKPYFKSAAGAENAPTVNFN